MPNLPEALSMGLIDRVRSPALPVTRAAVPGAGTRPVGRRGPEAGGQPPQSLAAGLVVHQHDLGGSHFSKSRSMKSVINSAA
ncbi:MAG: hypothetical protein GY722_09830 [bacterium]|nr:hypothetical protein [bacterium]